MNKSYSEEKQLKSGWKGRVGACPLEEVSLQSVFSSPVWFADVVRLWTEGLLSKVVS